MPWPQKGILSLSATREEQLYLFFLSVFCSACGYRAANPLGVMLQSK